MLDPDEVADYEAWKQHKLTASVDLSIAAYNTEMEAPALAYEAGVRDGVREAVGSDLQKFSSVCDYVIAASPYRKPGMRGYRAPTNREEEE